MDLKEKFAIEFAEAVKKDSITVLYLNFPQAWSLICAIQAALKDRHFVGLIRIRQMAELLGRSLGNAVCTTPAIKEFEQMCWANAQLPSSLHLEKNLN